MPLVERESKQTFRVALDRSLIKELEAYRQWCGSTKVRIVETALKRLFEQDTEWQAHLVKQKEIQNADS